MAQLSNVAAIIELTNDDWDLVEDLFDPTGRRGIPARYSRRLMVEAILFLARTGCSPELRADGWLWRAIEGRDQEERQRDAR